MENNWYKIFPLQILSHVDRIPDATMHGDFLLLAMHCLEKNGLPDDNEELSWLTRLSVDRIQQLRPYLNRLSDAVDGKLMIRFVGEIIQERVEYAERRSNAGKQGGRPAKPPTDSTNGPSGGGTSEPKHDETEPFNAEPENSNGKQCFSDESNAFPEKALLSIVKQSKAIHTDIHTNKQEGNAPTRYASEPGQNATPAKYREVDLDEMDRIVSAVSRITGTAANGKNLNPVNQAAISIFQSGGTFALLEEFERSLGKQRCKLNFIAQDFGSWFAAREREQDAAKSSAPVRPPVVTRPENWKYLNERKAN